MNKLPAMSKKRHEWETLVITLDPGGDRFADFVSHNSHLRITPFQAIRGTDLSKDEIVGQRLATEELVATTLLTTGAIGCAASHRAIWEKSSKEGVSLLVIEDDCCTHPDINDFVAANLSRLSRADLCFFGINTDSILLSISPQGLVSLSLFDPKYPSPEWIEASLSRTSSDRVELHRMLKGFGTCAYFISPQGARKMLEKIFPLSLDTTDIPLIADRMPAISIDRSECAIYAGIEALICRPFLAYTPNHDSATRA